jgi:acetyl-CoA acetyltransferase
LTASSPAAAARSTNHGAAGAVVASRAYAARRGLRPLARLVAVAAVGDDLGVAGIDSAALALEHLQVEALAMAEHTGDTTDTIAFVGRRQD